MDKQTYETIMASLDERLTNCKVRFDRVAEAGSLDNLTVKELLDLQKFCVEEYESMTKFAMVDLYHIIGMGNLAPQQMSKFAFKAQAYTSYRPDVKAIAERLNSLDSLPDIPTHTKFRLLTFRDITLYRGEPEDTCVEDTTDIEEYDKVKEAAATKNPVTPSAKDLAIASYKAECTAIAEKVGLTAVPNTDATGTDANTFKTTLYTMVDNQVIVKTDNLCKFFKYIAMASDSAIPGKKALERSKLKATSGGSCYGIDWDGMLRLDGTSRGMVLDNRTRTILTSVPMAIN